MPGSVRENDQFITDFVVEHDIDTVLDVGAGQGTYAQLLSCHVEQIDCIEVWQPYIDEFALSSQYDQVFHGDARTLMSRMGDYDMVIFGDVLEHMTEDEAVALWNEAGKRSIFGVISVPIVHYPQGEEFGNPYEVHVQEHLTPQSVTNMFGPFDYEEVYSVTGTFIRRF